MMNIGFIGIGKLGLPVSVCIALKGHRVFAYDISSAKLNLYGNGIPDTGSLEPGLTKQLKEAFIIDKLKLCPLLIQVWNEEPDIIFVAVPTPSKDDNSFDTSYVKQTLTAIADMPKKEGYTPVIAIISTVLPMTVRIEFAHLIGYPIVYNPFFIAMGTVIPDYLAPEFVLLGYDNPENSEAMKTMVAFYTSIYRDEPKQPPLLHMTWENAEACKMLYNTIIGAKVIIANTVMEMCHNVPYADCDVVVDAFEYATKRIIGSKYLRGGMPDAGLCHPRDQRALDYLCQKLDLSSNIFKFIMESREAQTRWLVDLIIGEKLSAVILGKRFKAGSNLIDDSGSVMVYNALEWMGVEVHYHDPMLNLEYYPSEPHVFLVAINEPWTRSYPYPTGSVVLDVWRQFDESDVEMLKVRGVKYVPVGRNQPCL